MGSKWKSSVELTQSWPQLVLSIAVSKLAMLTAAKGIHLTRLCDRDGMLVTAAYIRKHEGFVVAIRNRYLTRNLRISQRP